MTSLVVGLANFAFFQVDPVGVIDICDGSIINQVQVHSIHTISITNYINKFYLPPNKSVYRFYPRSWRYCKHSVHFQQRVSWEYWRVELNGDGVTKYKLDWAIITKPSQDNLMTSMTIANSLVIVSLENNLASLSAIGIRRGMLLEFVLFVSRPDTLSKFDYPPPFLHLIYIMYLWYRHFSFFLVPSPLQELNK